MRWWKSDNASFPSCRAEKALKAIQQCYTTSHVTFQTTAQWRLSVQNTLKLCIARPCKCNSANTNINVNFPVSCVQTWHMRQWSQLTLKHLLGNLLPVSNSQLLVSFQHSYLWYMLNKSSSPSTHCGSNLCSAEVLQCSYINLLRCPLNCNSLIKVFLCKNVYQSTFFNPFTVEMVWWCENVDLSFLIACSHLFSSVSCISCNPALLSDFFLAKHHRILLLARC